MTRLSRDLAGYVRLLKMGAYLRCKWCAYRVPRVRRTRKGTLTDGWHALAGHVADKHDVLVDWGCTTGRRT